MDTLSFADTSNCMNFYAKKVVQIYTNFQNIEIFKNLFQGVRSIASKVVKNCPKDKIVSDNVGLADAG